MLRICLLFALIEITVLSSVFNLEQFKRLNRYRWISLNILHRTTLGCQLYTYYRFVPCGSEQINLLNCKRATKHKDNMMNT